MKKNRMVLLVFIVLVSVFFVTSEVFSLNKTEIDLINKYKQALETKDPDIIRGAYEALKTNKQAVSYMQKNLPNLYQRFNQRAIIDEMNLAHQQQAARGEIIDFKEIEGSKFVPGKKMSTTKAVSGDPDLANLAEPGRGHVKRPKGDPDLADLVKGKGGTQPSSGSPKTKYTGDTKLSGDPAKTRLSGSGADTKYTGDTKLSSDPGKTKVSGQPKQNIASKRVPGDPDLAKLVEKARSAEQARAKVGAGAGEAPPATKVDRDPVRQAVREGREAVRGGESPPKTKIGSGTQQAKAKAKVGAGAGEGGRPSIQEIMNKNRGVVDPKKAGVEMPGRVPQDKLPPRRVSGDPDLANLAEPGRGHVKGPRGDPDLAKLAGGQQPGTRSNISGKTSKAVTVEGGASSSAYVGRPSIKQGISRAVGVTMAGGIVSHGVQKERENAAEEGRSFDPISAGVQTGRSLVGGDFKDHATQIANEEIQKENEKAQLEGRQPDYELAKAKALERVGSEVLNPAAWGESMGDRIGREEAQREIERAKAAGEAPSAIRANIESARRIVGEMTGMQAIYDNAMYDSDADRAAADMGRRVEGRRQDAILDMDDGLHEIALIQQRMRDLDKNPNQNDPWVKQRREELLDAYTAKRDELQRTNQALGADAGAGDGEYISIRGAVELIPEKPDYRRNLGEQIDEVAAPIRRDLPKIEEVAAPIRQDTGTVIDDLAKAMVDNQITAEEQAQWQNRDAADPNSMAGKAVRGFTGTSPSGYTETARIRHTSERMTKTPDEVKKKDIEAERRKAKEQDRQADQQRADQQRIDEAQFTNDWSSTIRDINDSLSELNEQDAQKVKDMAEAAIIMIQQMQNGTLSDENFTQQMAALENEQANLQRGGVEGWQRIRDRLIGDKANPGSGRADIQIGSDGADPCVNNFTMTNNSELRCKCPGYTFDNSKARCVKTGGGAGAGSAGGIGNTASSRGGGSATGTGGNGGGSTGRKGMMYRIHTPPYGGGVVCLTSEEAEKIRNAPNTVLFESLGQTCIK
ncbi:MAG: hypothetical protein U5R49_18065 [Deltaproteobacteria bacterium]|nr:hypothetical protein [Deltaproteobacteria bacterium]